MTYTTLSQLKSLNDKDTVEAVPAVIAFVKDPETDIAKGSGKPYEKQGIKLVASDGTEVWATIFDKRLFMDRSSKDKKAIFCSTVKDGKMQGVSVGIWGGKVSLSINGSANITFPDGAPAAQSEALQQQSQQSTQQHSQPQQRTQQSQPVNGLTLGSFVDMWLEIYQRIQPVVQNETATAATTTIFIEANKKNIGPTLTAPRAAIASLTPDAKKIADAVIAKGGFDADKLPSGELLDEVVDLLFDKASETVSRGALEKAFDAFIAAKGGSRESSVKMLVADWAVFVGGVL